MVYREANPQYHLVKVRGMLNAVIRHCREDTEKVAEPNAQALFRMTSELLEGLIAAYGRCERELEDTSRGMAA